MLRVISLRRVEACVANVVGAKAAALAQLMSHRVPVVPGVVVPVAEQRRFFRENGLIERVTSGGDATIAEDICSGVIDPGLVEDLVSALPRGKARFAVRSSGVSEDGAAFSFAGQYETVLDVPVSELASAIRRCWASVWSGPAMAYRAHTNAPGSIHVGMAVLIQPMLDARTAGVMFSVNPLTGSWREMTVEAAWGHGEAVVGGHVVPDFYVVRRPRRAPRPVQRVLARVQLEVIADHVHPQEMAWSPAGRDLTIPVSPVAVDAPKLRHAELFKLCRLGLRLEAIMGCPQDIEWTQDERGRFVVLQSRPVTTTVGVRRSGPTLWTRRFVGERWTEPVTPLGWSIMRDLINDFIAYPKTSRELLDGGAPSQLVRFAPYFNVTVFRHLSFKLPGMPPPRFMMELLPPDEERRWLRRRGQSPDFRVYAAVLKETLAGRRWRRFRYNPFTNYKVWAQFEGELDDKLAGLERVLDNGGDSKRVRAECALLAETYVGIHICSLLFANLLFQLSDGWLAARGRSALAQDALRPDRESWTVRTNHALWRLGRGEMTETAFMALFGHRATNSWELFSERWVEVPEHVQILARAAAEHGNPQEMAKDQVHRAVRARQDLDRPLRWVVELAQRYLLLRENQRFQFDRLLWVWKRAYLQLEAELGLSIRFLEVDELEALVADEMSKEDATGLIQRRRLAWQGESQRRIAGDEPPVFLVGDDAVEPLVPDRRLQGMGISRGLVTGVVRVLHSIDEADRLQAGEILVAHATDPGWTPLFLKASGLVMEMGGMLSHGAVVAREYGLPAVVNVSGATQQLVDGQRITIDGSRGMVWVH